MGAGSPQRGLRRAESPHGGLSGATALVNEAFLELVGNEDWTRNNRQHSLTAASSAMRHILVDHARANNRQKRSSDGERVLHGIESPAELPAIELLDLDDALVGWTSDASHRHDNLPYSSQQS